MIREGGLVWGRRLQMAGVATALVAVVLWAAGPVGAAPALTVTPATGLTDRQIVTVSVSGFDFAADVSLVVVQCNPNPLSIEECDVGLTQDLLALDADGTGSAPFTVHVLPPATGGQVNCDADHPCTLAVLANPQDFSARKAFATISFAPGQTASTTSSTSTSSTSTSSSTTSSSATSSTSTTSPSGSSSSTTSTSGPGSSSTTSTSGPGSSSTTSTSGPGSSSTTSTTTGSGGAATTTSTRLSSTVSPLAAPSAAPTGLVGPATLPVTGAGDRAPVLLGLGLALGTAGSVVRRRALASA